MAKLINITGKAIAGEWGQDDPDGTGIPVLRTTNFTNDGIVNYDNVVTRQISKRNLSDKMLRNGDIIIEKSGGSDNQPVGRVIYFEGKADTYLFNNFTGLLRVNNQDVWLPKYVFYALFSNYQKGGTKAFENRTTGLHNLQTESYVAKTEIPEVPMFTQRRIASTLDAITALIAKRHQQLDALDQLVKARFVEMTETAGAAPTRMGDIATYVNGYAFKPTQWEEEGYPIIRIQNLNDSNAPYNYFSGQLPDKYLIHKGDVLVSWATHLEAYIWNGTDAWLNQHIFKVEFDKMDVDKVYYVYACEEALKQAFKNAHGFKPTMEHIRKCDFDDAIVRLPELKTQHQFATFVAEVDKSKWSVRQSLQSLETLKKSLMQQYFG